MRIALAVIVAAILAVVPSGATAEERATTKQAEALVHKAVALLRKDGKEKAFAVFTDPNGPFTYRDLYVFVYDLDGVVRAHGAKKALVGKRLWDTKDAEGRYWVRERVALARSKGSGWQEYKFPNPLTGAVEKKVAYIELVDDVIVGCGAYLP